MRQGVNLQFDTSTFLSFNWDTVRVLCWESKDGKKKSELYFNFTLFKETHILHNLSDSKRDVQDFNTWVKILYPIRKHDSLDFQKENPPCSQFWMTKKFPPCSYFYIPGYSFIMVWSFISIQ